MFSQSGGNWVRQMQYSFLLRKLTVLGLPAGNVLKLCGICLCRLQQDAPHLCWQEILRGLQQEPRHMGQVLGGAQGAGRQK